VVRKEGLERLKNLKNLKNLERLKNLEENEPIHEENALNLLILYKYLRIYIKLF
jgi:hypothetical protein